MALDEERRELDEQAASRGWERPTFLPTKTDELWNRATHRFRWLEYDGERVLQQMFISPGNSEVWHVVPVVVVENAPQIASESVDIRAGGTGSIVNGVAETRLTPSSPVTMKEND